MMKKIFAIFIMVFLLVNGVYVSGYCSDSFDGKVDKHQDERLISRSDCLTFVMIAIGTFPYIHESYGGIPYEEYYNEWSMCDFDSVLTFRTGFKVVICADPSDKSFAYPARFCGKL